AVRDLNVPILFIAGGADRRMPPSLADRMFKVAKNPVKQLLVIPDAHHGETFATDRMTYLNTVYSFLERVRYSACSGCSGEVKRWMHQLWRRSMSADSPAI